jgi:hypothetical protein
MAGVLPRQGAREAGAAAGGGPQPGRSRGKPRLRARSQRRAHSVRLSEREIIAAGAEAVGMSIAGFLAQSALAAARDLDRTAAAIASQQDTLTALFAIRRQLGYANNNLNQVAHALNSGAYPNGLDATITAVHRAADDVRHITTLITDPNTEGGTA